jgi:hypothetical protein
MIDGMIAPHQTISQEVAVVKLAHKAGFGISAARRDHVVTRLQIGKEIVLDAPANPARNSAGGVPAIRKCKQRPSQIVVIGGTRRRKIERHQAGHDVLPRDWLNSRSHGIQQSLKFGFAHGTLPIESTTSQSFLLS